MLVDGLNKIRNGNVERNPRTPQCRTWSEYRETFCENKTETNTNADAIFFESHDTISHSKMDRRRTRRVRPKLFQIFEKDDQIASTLSFCTTRGRWSSWIQYFGTDVCLQISRLLSICQFEHGCVICEEEVAPRRDFSIAWTLTLVRPFFTFEQFKATLEDNWSIQHCKTTCCYRATSPSTSTTLEAPTTCTPSSNQDWFRVEKILRKRGQTVFFTAVNPMSIHLHKQRITTRRSPELQCANKIGKYTRKQCTGPI